MSDQPPSPSDDDPRLPQRDDGPGDPALDDPAHDDPALDDAALDNTVDTDAPTGPAARAAALDAAFQGPEWSSRRRRRTSSSTPAITEPPGGTPAAPPAATRTRTADEPDARERRRARRRRRRIRRAVGYGLAGLVVLTGLWIVVTGLIAASQLGQARSELTALRTQLASGDLDQARQTAAALAGHARHAQVLTTGPAWATVAAVPYVGGPLQTVRGVTAQTSVLASDAVPGLIAVADRINPRTVVSNGATVDLAALASAAGPVNQATDAIGRAQQEVGDLPGSTWLPFVDHARDAVATQLDGFGKTLVTADQALRVLPTMLGGDGTPRRYFIAFQNNAELRGTGGLPGAFAIASAVNGTVTLERFESDSLLVGVPSGLDFGAAYDAHYGGDTPYTQYVDSNVSPHFPYAAQIWCAMWQNVTGEKLDGALTVDPSALSYLLAASGPAKASDGTSVTAANVVSLLQKDVYAKFPEPGDNDDRKDYILDIAEAAEKKVLAGGGNSRALLNGLARGVSERRIVAWSNDPAVEAVLAGAPIGGTVPATTQPYSQLSVNNGAAGKLDYYLDRTVSWARTGCGDTRTVKVTITLTNRAPASGLPAYTLGLPQFLTPGAPPGQNRSVVDYLATTGAQLTGTTVDGKAAGAGVFDEEGHPTYRVILELAPGQTSTVVLTLQEPAGGAPVTVVKQPGVVPVVVTTDDQSCS